MASSSRRDGFFPISGGIEMLLPGREDEGVNYRLPFRVATTSNVYHALRGIPDGAAAMPVLNNFLGSIEVYSPHRSTTGQGLYRETTTSKEIRVLVLDPAQCGDPVVGSLRHLTIEYQCPPELKGPYKEIFGPGSWHFAWIAHTQFGIDLETKQMVPYTALSYVWGDQSHLTPVMIDGYEKLITPSLLAALQKLRHQSEHVVLWIDQICIDQGSDLDKQKQIQLMGDIYKRAWTTAIWTGEEPDHGAFEALQSLHEATQGLRDLTEGQIAMLRDSERHRLSGVPDQPEAFFDRSWFKRTWIIQEAVLSRDAYLLAGDNSIPWSNLGGWSYDLAELGILREQSEAEHHKDPQKMHGWRAAGEIYKLGEAFNQSSELPVLRTLVDTRDAQATKAVDKIYGVLGLCEIDITPDYTLAPHDLFFRVASIIVDEYFGHRVFSLLSCVGHEPQKGSPSSWTIDWSTPRVTQALAFISSTFNCFDAGGHGMPSAKQWLCQRTDNKLMLRGKRFSTINELSPILTHTRLIADASTLSSSALKTCIDFAAGSTPGLPATFTSFVKTLVAGKDGSARNKPPIEFLHLASLLCDEASGKKPTFPDQIYSKRHQQGHFTLNHLKQRSMGRHFESFRKAFAAALTNRRLCWTASAQLCLVPRYAEAGDEIWAFPYSAIPFVLRPTEDGQFLIIGEGYCHEVMDGLFAVDETEPLQDVVLI